MSLLGFLEPSNSTVPPLGTSAHKAYLRSTGSTPDQGASAYAAQQSIPPVGTSAYKAYEYAQEFGRPAPTILELISGDYPINNPNPKPHIPSAKKISSSPASVPLVDYLNAELAKHYGMSASTAYQEALSNTSYQRAVKDMKAAGLNPAVMFGAGRAQGASSGIYASSSGSGSGSRSRGYSSSNDKLFSGSAYSAIQAIGGLIGVAALKRPDGYWIGSQTAKGAMGLMDSISKLLK